MRAHASELYGPDFLVERPLLKAIRSGAGAVLLIDELDRADDEFEAFLLEILSDYTVTVPEIGTIAAAEPPAVVVTSNRTRELHDALKRRCLYHSNRVPGPRARGGDHPSARARGATAAGPFGGRGGGAAAQPRPGEAAGAAQAIDWARALALLGADDVSGPNALQTLGWAVKNRDDLRTAEAALPEALDA